MKHHNQILVTATIFYDAKHTIEVQIFPRAKYCIMQQDMVVLVTKKLKIP